MKVEQKIFNELISHPRRTIQISELEEIMENFFKTYEDYAQFILKLEQENILQMVKTKGRTTRNPSLAFLYRINKNLLRKNFHQEIQRYRNKLHPAINLDEYFNKNPHIWEEDLPYLLKIDEFLKTNGFPKDIVPAPERSFELVQDEKWITEKGGKEVLDRIGLFQKLKMIPVSDPLMFAINPKKIANKKQIHLIVENKTTYQGLLPALQITQFSTLIYGSGKRVIQSIELFPDQYPVHGENYFFYFGDIDREGISIWYSLTKKIPVQLAMPFYEACLQKQPVEGKNYQKQFKEAQVQFLNEFPQKWQEQLQEVFTAGKYYPQEILKSKELQTIWRESEWEILI